MIKQTSIGLNSRSEVNPYNKEGFLPLVTAPMYSVVDETNYQIFLDNKIQVCLPRKTGYVFKMNEPVFVSLSLQEFVETYIILDVPLGRIDLICIDTANGNMPDLHDAIRKAKEMHGNNLIIMAGNVASVEAFIELAKTGVDYIRVGIGGGGGCNTTSNTGVGQEDLEKLINDCYYYKNILSSGEQTIIFSSKNKQYFIEKDALLVSKVKIVADGISSYVKQCETKYGFNDNGYAAINKLLFAGADLVMIGKLFAQCLESAGEKRIQDGEHIVSIEEYNQWYSISTELSDHINDGLMVKYSGMSTLEEQKKYKSEPIYKYAVYKGNGVLAAYYETQSEAEKSCSEDKNYTWKYLGNIKPSEGSVSWIPVRFSLNEWLNGSEDQDCYPHLMGYAHSLRSAMSYTNRKNL